MNKLYSFPKTAGLDVQLFKQRAIRNLYCGFLNLSDVIDLLVRKYQRYFEVLIRRDPHAVGKKRPSWLTEIRPSISDASAETICSRIPYVMSGLGAISSAPVWEEPANEPEDYFAAHRFAWLLTCDPLNSAQAADARTRVDEWITGNNNLMDRAWETYSACERIGNLVSWLSLIPQETRVKFLPKNSESFFRASAATIVAHPEYYGNLRTNNHILNNGRALVMLGRILGDTGMHDRGVAILERMLPVMVGEGGMLRERSSHYQFVVLGWVLDASRYAATPGTKEVFGPYVKRMAGAAVRLLDGRGALAAEIGDISPDMSPSASLARLALLHPGWQNGTAPVDGPSTDDWYFLSAGGSRVMVNYPVGNYPFRYPTHGHCDLTSFVWSLDDERILVDAGRFRYTTDTVSEHQRSAAGHNLPLVDGFSPLCEPFGVSGWMPTPYASATLVVEGIAPNKLIMRHTGLERLQRGMRHLRAIDVKDQGIDVVDSFAGSGVHTVTLLWHFPLTFRPLADNGGAGNGRFEVTVETSGAGPTSYHWFYGDSAGLRASRAYGTSESLTTLVVELRCSFPAEVRTSFRVAPCAA